MIAGFRTVYEGRSAEIIEKKSRFIATVYSVNSEEEAVSYIESLRKKYWNATHNCYAYVIGINNEVQRFSDDGEPSQTAGKPILDVILGEGIHNTLIVVTRYFGGTLLGTGGLVRAYSKSAKEGLKNSSIIDKVYGRKLCITTDYNGIGKIQYIIGTMNIQSVDVEYTDIVRQIVVISEEKLEEFTNKIVEVTSARAVINEVDEGYFAILDGEVIGL